MTRHRIRQAMCGLRDGPTLVGACILALLLAGPVPALAGGDGAGTTAASFLSVGTGAGVLGRGGATQGLSGDLAIVPWNAAALGWLAETEVAIAHAGLEDQARQEWAAVAGRLGHSPLRWSLDGLYQSEGSFDGRDASGNPTGDFDVSSMAMAVHFASPLGPFVTAGVGGKYVGERLGTVSGAGFTADAGLQMRAGLVGAGISATNLGGSMSYAGSRYDLPANVGVGAALDLPFAGIRLAVDANFPRSYYQDVRVGAEWRWRDLVALRAGYRREVNAPADLAEAGPSFGVGAGARGMWFDYAYIVPGSGDGQHRLSVTLRPGKFAWLVRDRSTLKDVRRDFDDTPSGSTPTTKPQAGSSGGKSSGQQASVPSQKK
jgi:hypothetical protein